MLRALFLHTIGKLIARPIRRRLAMFEQATHDPRGVQDDLLRRILAHQARTAFGRDHGFGDVRTVADFRRRVPVKSYEYVEPYIARVRQGETDALLADRPVMFALTSGTTASRKFIPVTPQYLADYRRGWNMWGLKAWGDHKDAVLRPMIQLAGDPDEFRTEAGTPCGAVSGLTAEMQKKIVRWLYCVPATTARIKESAVRYHVALRFSLPKPQIGMLLSANPSTLVALARFAEANAEALVRDLHDGTLSAKLDIPPAIRERLTRKLKPHPERARELEEVIKRVGWLRLGEVWPADKLLIGTWTGGSVGPYLRQLPRYYGETGLRDLGLIASEGRMTLPWSDGTSAGILDITSHYFEFIPESEIDSEHPTVLGAHELAEGGHYYILPTTFHGLYRYHICDLVRVAGFFNKTPLLEFLGKGNRFANLTGEKLSEHHVTRAMAAVQAELALGLPAGYSVAPVWHEEQPYYGLFVERGEATGPGMANRLLEAFERHLGERNIEYASKRDSGRLGPVRLCVLPPGTWERWDRERLAKTGGPPEQYKHPCLLGDVAFKATMPVEAEIAAEPAGTR